MPPTSAKIFNRHAIFQQEDNAMTIVLNTFDFDNLGTLGEIASVLVQQGFTVEVISRHAYKH